MPGAAAGGSGKSARVLLGSAGASILLALSFVFACREPSPPELSLAGEALGTTYSVKVVPAGAAGEARRAELEGVVEAALERVDRLMSTYRSDSELSRFNRAAAGVAVPLSPETQEVFALALQVFRESGGAFDVTVAPLVDAWGFGPHRHHHPPTAEVVQDLRRRVGSQLLGLDPAAGTLTKSRDGVECDLSAVAKGYAVDRVAEALEAAGEHRYMVEVGGEIRARGHNRHARPWQIAVERPTPESRGVQRILPLSSGALATSGDYRNFYELDGRRYSHTLDPRTGAPVTHTLASVSVLAGDCATADAWATALLVLGPEHGRRLAELRNIPALFLVHTSSGGIEERTTPALDAFLASAGEGPADVATPAK